MKTATIAPGRSEHSNGSLALSAQGNSPGLCLPTALWSFPFTYNVQPLKREVVRATGSLCSNSGWAGKSPRLASLLSAAVKELDLCYHNMNMWQILWFLDSGN